MKVHIVFAENDEAIYVPVAVFDNEAAAQHRANNLLYSCVMSFELEHEDTAPEIVQLTWNDGEIDVCPASFEDDLKQYQGKAEIQYFHVLSYQGLCCIVDILVDKALLVGDWKEQFDVYCQTITKQGKQMFVDGADWEEVRKTLLDKIKADLKSKEE